MNRRNFLKSTLSSLASLSPLSRLRLPNKFPAPVPLDVATHGRVVFSGGTVVAFNAATNIVAGQFVTLADDLLTVRPVSEGELPVGVVMDNTSDGFTWVNMITEQEALEL